MDGQLNRKATLLTMAAVLLAVVAYFSLNLQKPRLASRDARIDWLKIEAAKDFRDLFQPIEEIILTGDLITDIKQLIILPDRKMIIRESKAVKLFGANGEFKRAVGGIGQGPGEYLKSNYVAIDDSSNIYILDTISSKVVVFNALGQQKGNLKLERTAEEMAIIGDRLCFYSAVNFYREYMAFCYERGKDKKFFDFAKPTESLKTLKSNLIPPPFGFGYYLASCQEKIFIAHPFEYTIREFSLSGRELRQIKGKSRSFTPTDPTKKFTPSISPAELLDSIIKSMLISNDLFFVFYFGNLNSQEMYFDVFTLDGEQINESTIVSKEQNAAFADFFLTSAPDGYFYSFCQPEAGNAGEVPNPVIVKYKFLALNAGTEQSEHKDRGN